MPSRYGARRGEPEYDRFRTGLTYKDVHAMLYSPDPDRTTWRHRRRGSVLGYWHALKKQMWTRLKNS